MSNKALSELSIVYQAAEALNPYANNARTHSKRQIRQIADSMKAFGFTNPVLVDCRKTIIAGHGRVEAAKLLGIRTVPTIELSELSEDEARQITMANSLISFADKEGLRRSSPLVRLRSHRSL